MIFYCISKQGVYSEQIFIKSDKSLKELYMFMKKVSKNNYVSKSNAKIHNSKGDSFDVGIIYTTYYKDILENVLCDEKILQLSQDEWLDKAIEFEKNLKPTNEQIIREKTTSYIQQTYNAIHLQEEFTHTSIDVRADLFAITGNKETLFVEIKSDRDTFTRLSKQLDGYKKFANLIYVAIDITHLKKYLKNFNGSKYSNIGILVFEDEELIVFKEPYNNEYIDCESLLWKQEFIQMLHLFKGNYNNKGIIDLIDIAHNIYTVAEYIKLCNYLFINRYAHEKLDFSEIIQDIEYKQKLLEQYKKKGK